MARTEKQTSAQKKAADDKQYRIAQSLAVRAHQAGYAGVRCLRDWYAQDPTSYREAALEEEWAAEETMRLQGQHEGLAIYKMGRKYAIPELIWGDGHEFVLVNRVRDAHNIIEDFFSGATTFRRQRDPFLRSA